MDLSDADESMKPSVCGPNRTNTRTSRGTRPKFETSYSVLKELHIQFLALQTSLSSHATTGYILIMTKNEL
ncbi:hypothetical protein AMTRI_Chr12g274860 [Amborella trichopoda]